MTSPLGTRRTIIVGFLGAMIGLSLALLYGPTAHADEASFAQAVGNDGMPVTATTLALGHMICQDVLTNGVAGVDNEVRMALVAGMAPHDAANLIGDAVIELCPAGLPAAHAWAASMKSQVA